MLFTCVLLAISAQPSVSSDTRDAFQADHRGAEKSLRIAPGLDGLVRTVIGTFDVGVVPRDDPQTITMAVAGFIEAHKSQFVGDTEAAIAPLVLTKTFDLEDGGFVSHFEQSTTEGLRFLNSEATASFDADGMLHSINGAIRLAASTQDVAMPVDEVSAILEVAPYEWQIASDGNFASYDDVAGSGATLERTYNAKLGSPQWVFVGPDGERRLSERSLSREDVDRTDPAIVLDSCDVRYIEYAKTSTFTTDFRVTSGTRVESPFCEADEMGAGLCRWWLKYSGDFFTPVDAPLHRVDDFNSSTEEYRDTTCTGANAVFGGVAGDSIQEQNAYIAVETMRFYMLDNVWNFSTPDNTGLLQVHIDATGECSSSDACFEAFSGQDIFFDSNGIADTSLDLDVGFHEYGHFVVWSYDDVSNECDNSDDHGNMLDEALADVFGLIAAADDPDINPSYGALSGFAGGQPPPAHVSGTGLQFVADCTLDSHDMGLAFEAAMWEMMWNRDCAVETCTAATTMTRGTRYFASTSQEVVLQRTGRAVAHAMKVLGPNVTFQQVVLQIIDKIDTTGDNDLNAESLFDHHGLW